MRLYVQVIKQKKEQKVTEFTSMQAYGSVSKHTRTQTQTFPHNWLDPERIRKFKVKIQIIFICVFQCDIIPEISWNTMEKDITVGQFSQELYE